MHLTRSLTTILTLKFDLIICRIVNTYKNGRFSWITYSDAIVPSQSKTQNWGTSLKIWYWLWLRPNFRWFNENDLAIKHLLLICIFLCLFILILFFFLKKIDCKLNIFFVYINFIKECSFIIKNTYFRSIYQYVV